MTAVTKPAPTGKQQAVASSAGGGATLLVLWVLRAQFHMEIPDSVVAVIASAVPAGIAVIVGLPRLIETAIVRALDTRVLETVTAHVHSAEFQAVVQEIVSAESAVVLAAVKTMATTVNRIDRRTAHAEG